jgi:hypothetical protein
MNDREKTRQRFLRDSLPRRLGGLAATFGRISSSARKTSDPTVVADLLDEARRMIEWTAGETEPEAAAELVRIQTLLSIWQKAWGTASQEPGQRLLLSLLAKDWSDKAVDFSGLA